MALLLVSTILLNVNIMDNKIMATDDIAINETNFPDENFRRYVSEEIDANGNNVLSESEILSTTEMNISRKWSYGDDIENLKGIEFFTELERLDCSVSSQ